MVLGITPNTKFVYSLKHCQTDSAHHHLMQLAAILQAL